jgi:hypothetical protein
MHVDFVAGDCNIVTQTQIKSNQIDIQNFILRGKVIP